MDSKKKPPAQVVAETGAHIEMDEMAALNVLDKLFRDKKATVKPCSNGVNGYVLTVGRGQYYWFDGGAKYDGWDCFIGDLGVAVPLETLRRVVDV